MLTIQSIVTLDGITGRQISDFVLDCTDDAYRRWWPGTHLQFHPLARGGTDHVGDVVYIDEYIGVRRVRMTSTFGLTGQWRHAIGSSRPAVHTGPFVGTSLFLPTHFADHADDFSRSWSDTLTSTTSSSSSGFGGFSGGGGGGGGGGSW